MYDIGTTYKILTKEDRTYTCEVLAEDAHAIKILDKYNEIKILNKSIILDAKVWNGDGNGENIKKC